MFWISLEKVADLLITTCTPATRSNELEQFEHGGRIGMKILFLFSLFENKARYREDHDKSRKCACEKSVHNEFIFLLSWKFRKEAWKRLDQKERNIVVNITNFEGKINSFLETTNDMLNSIFSESSLRRNYKQHFKSINLRPKFNQPFLDPRVP